MVLNNVTKFHKILIKTYIHERTSFGQTYERMYVRTDERTGVTLNAPAIVMAGAKYFLMMGSVKDWSEHGIESLLPATSWAQVRHSTLSGIQSNLHLY